MKKLLLGSAAFLLLSAGAANATDMPIKAPIYKAAAPFSWDGLYIGGHAGYGWGSYKSFDADFGGFPTASFDPKGWFGGVQIGENSLIAPNWLLGSEVDLSAGHIRGSGFDTVAAPLTNLLSDRIDLFGTARVRLGYVVDHTLIYGTGGTAWAVAKSGIAGPLVLGTNKEHYVGWVIGGGVEYAFDPRWSVKLEYLYSDFGKQKDATAFGGPVQNTADLTLSTVKLGLNYRLGDPRGNSTAGMPMKASYALPFSWNGSYIGAHVGYDWSQFDGRQSAAFVVPPFAVESLKPHGWFGGFQTGYNWQFAPIWVFGVETDNSFISSRASGIGTAPGGFFFPTTAKVDDLGTVRVRLGYALDRSLIYATGGLAYAHQKTTVSFFGGEGTDKYDIGWTAGGGIEYAFDPRWSVKVEYLYADLGGQTRIEGGTDHTELKMQTVKVGLNYKLDLAALLRGGR